MAMTPQEAAAAGLGWVPENHPMYGKPGFVGGDAGGTTGRVDGGGLQGTQGAGGTQVQYNYAGGTPEEALAEAGRQGQNYSTTPGAAPAQNTTNQATQDVTRNRYLQLATQGPVDRNNPNVRLQADAYGANVDRQRRDYLDESAERLGPYATGALDNERRLTAERAGQAKGLHESELVGREIMAQRQEILQALQGLTGLISDDQRRQLEMRLAELDAALRREGLGATTALGNRELDIRDRLGTQGNILQALAMALQNRQFGNDLGFRIGATEADLNNQALRYWF